MQKQITAKKEPMKTVDIVIGANYGDEGKGLFTDYIAARHDKNVCVVRHNGGAQAGHTVVLPDGRRHVHHHFASGALAGYDTWLSRFFVCNPIIFRQERTELVATRKQNVAWVNVDKNCAVTTPFDMLINIVAEEARGDARHGSCGAGFGETIERHGCGDDRFSTRVSDLKSMDRRTLENIRSGWVPARLKRLGIEIKSKATLETFHSRGLIDNFLEDVQYFIEHTVVRPDYLLNGYVDHLVFEGAQGLGLDQHRGHFPYVTRSNTGVWNALRYMPINYSEVKPDIWYCTRPYMTRHGRGPLNGEMAGYIKVVDTTNVWNQHQEGLRYAPLDVVTMGRRIWQDTEDITDNRATFHLAVSCNDHMLEHDVDGYLTNLQNSMFWNTTEMLTSWGPRRCDIEVRETP